MSRGTPRVALRASPVHDPLLRLVFSRDEQIARRWRDLQPFDLDALDAGSLCVLPLLHQRLVDGAVDDPLLQRLLGTSRKAWYRSQLQLERLAPAVTALRAAGVEPLLVGAAARATLYVTHPGLRVVPFLELAVAPSDVAAAGSALAEAGWRPVSGPVAAGATRFEVGERVTLVLHDGAPDGLSKDRERTTLFELLRTASRCRTVSGVTVRTLDPADELLVVCGVDALHGDPSSLQPLLDAHQILDSAEHVDPARLNARARGLGLVLAVHGVLARLHELSETARVDDAVAALEGEPVRRRDRLMHRLEASRFYALKGLSVRLQTASSARKRSASS